MNYIFKPKPDLKCAICNDVLTEWLSLPLLPSEPFFNKIKWKKIPLVSKEVSNILFRLIAITTPLDIIVMTKMKNSCVCKYLTEYDNAFELEWRCLYEALTTAPHFRREMSHLEAILQDASIITDPGVFKHWVGYWMDKILETLPNIHKEHCGMQLVSECGAAPGLGLCKKMITVDPLYDIMVSYQ
jgi:hypothetical protein